MRAELYSGRHCSWASLGHGDSTDIPAFFQRLADSWEEDLPDDLSVIGIAFQREESDLDEGPFLWTVTLFSG